MSERKDTHLEFTPEAFQTITAMQDHVNTLAMYFGRSSDEYREAVESLAHSLVAMIGLGGRITKDGPLSLYGASWIHYGVVFHRNGYVDDDVPEPGTWSVHS